jgi:hypothetical protein
VKAHDVAMILADRHRDARPPSVEKLREHGRVRLLQEMKSNDGRLLPSDACGTIIHIYRGAAAMEVEFTHPFGAIVTLTDAQVEPA